MKSQKRRNRNGRTQAVPAVVSPEPRRRSWIQLPFIATSWPLAIGLAALAFVFALVFYTRGTLGFLERDWFIDEGHKVSEAKAFKRYIAGEVHDPAWFWPSENVVNPPVPKFLSGALILLTGNVIPEDGRIRWVREPVTQSLPPVGSEDVYLKARAQLRSLSLFVTATLVASLIAMAARFGGLFAAAIAAGIILRHRMVVTYATVAMFDVLLALTVFATIAPLAWLATASGLTEGRRMTIAGVAGVLAAVAFQTKLSGAIAAMALAVCLVLFAPRGLKMRSFVLLCASAVVTVLLLNPWYWAASPVPLRPTPVGDSVLLRPLSRFVLQVSFAKQIAARHGSERFSTAANKLSLAKRVLVGSRTGLMTLAGVLLSLLLWRSVPRWLLLWAAFLIVGFIAWVPLPWGRYLYPALPPMVLLSALGWNALMLRVLTLFRTHG